MKNKILTLLGFAAKAGKLSYGMQSVIYTVKANKSKLVVISNDISPKSKKEVLFFTHNNNVPIINLNDINIQDMSGAVGRKCGIISINDSGFSDAISNIGGYANDQ